MKTNYVCNECHVSLNTNDEYCTMCAPHMITTKEATMSDLEIKKQNAKDWFTFNKYLKEATTGDEVYAVKRELEEKYPELYSKHEAALNKRCRNLAYKFNKAERKLDKASKEVKMQMQEAEAWLIKHGMQDAELPMEKDVMAAQLGDDPKKTTYAEWEAQCVEFYEFIKACREASGENVSLYWRGANTSNVSLEAENSDTKVDFVSSSAPVEQWGNLETALRLFTEGISTGKQFENTFRTSYFEEGMNAADTYHADIEFIGTENAANKIRKMNESYTKNLVKAMEEKSFRTQKRLKDAESKVDGWMAEAKEQIELLVSTSKNMKSAEYIRVYDALRNAVRKGTEYAYNMPFINTKEVKFDVPVERTEALAALKDAKGANSLLIKELNEFKKELIATKYPHGFKSFDKIKEYLADLIAMTGMDDAVQTVKAGEIFKKLDYKNALEIASSRQNDCRFTKEEFTVLARAGMVTRKKATKKKVDNVSPATAELIARLQGGDIDAATPENAKEILKAAASGKKYRLERETYMYVKELVA